MPTTWKNPFEHPGFEVPIDSSYSDIFQPADLASCNQQRHTAKDPDQLGPIRHIDGYQNFLA